MKKTFLLLCTAATIVSCNARPAPRELPEQVTLTKERLLDKIKGGWAGQTIGCTYGGPTEFKFNGTMIQEYTPIPWPEHYIKWWYENTPGLYDDVYMDLTFVEVFDRLGIDAPVDSLAATWGIVFTFFSSRYLDVSVHAVPSFVLSLQLSGLLHSEISGSTFDCNYPELIAAYHVLHQLLLPRHSLCALNYFNL